MDRHQRQPLKRLEKYQEHLIFGKFFSCMTAFGIYLTYYFFFDIRMPISRTLGRLFTRLNQVVLTEWKIKSSASQPS